MDVFIAAAYAQLGEEKKARQLVAEMVQNYPRFHYRPWLERWLHNVSLLTQTITLLQEAGLALWEPSGTESPLYSDESVAMSSTPTPSTTSPASCTSGPSGVSGISTYDLDTQ